MPPALQRSETFARTYRKGMDFLSELPHCGWKLLGIVVAIAIILFCACSSVWVLVLWAFGGKTLSYSVPEVVQKGAEDRADVGF